MDKQLLIYEKAVPVSVERHQGWSVKTGADYSFAVGVNSVPLTAVEFSAAVPEYAIVFAGTDEAVMPAVILGVRQQENAYLTESGSWQAKYVPAFVRRYPFVFSLADDGKMFALCIDEEFAGCNQEGRGEHLFDADGQRTQYLQSMLAFLQQYQAHFQRTQAFCKKLKELDLLEPMQAQVTLGTGERMSLGGFMAVNRQRLKGLTDEQLLGLARTDELELVYLHLQSMQNLRAMSDRLAGTRDTEEKASGPSKAEASFEEGKTPTALGV